MFKMKLLAGVAAVAFSGVASANILSTAGGNTEFVFSAFTPTVGYTYDLQDEGFDPVFRQLTDATTGEILADQVRMNSLIGTQFNTGTVPAIGGLVSIVANPAGGMIFDYALPGFQSFISQVNPQEVKWNLISAESSGIRRIVQTVTMAPTTALSDTQVVEGVQFINSHWSANSDNIGNHLQVADGHGISILQDLTAFAGFLGNDIGGKSYSSVGGLDDALDLYVIRSRGTSANDRNFGSYAQLVGEGDQALQARVYFNEASNGYHLAIAAVPEPETYAMLLAGLGMIGFAARRARRA